MLFLRAAAALSLVSATTSIWAMQTHDEQQPQYESDSSWGSYNDQGVMSGFSGLMAVEHGRQPRQYYSQKQKAALEKEARTKERYRDHMRDNPEHAKVLFRGMLVRAKTSVEQGVRLAIRYEEEIDQPMLQRLARVRERRPGPRFQRTGPSSPAEVERKRLLGTVWTDAIGRGRPLRKQLRALERQAREAIQTLRKVPVERPMRRWPPRGSPRERSQEERDWELFDGVQQRQAWLHSRLGNLKTESEWPYRVRGSDQHQEDEVRRRIAEIPKAQAAVVDYTKPFPTMDSTFNQWWPHGYNSRLSDSGLPGNLGNMRLRH